MHGVFSGFDIVGSGLRAELLRSEVVASNLANMHVTRGPDGEPYRRRAVVFEELLDGAMRGADEPPGSPRAQGVRVAEVFEDRHTPFTVVSMPGHPHADANGFVKLSNVDVFKEMVDMSVIERSFQANLAAMRSYRAMLESTLRHFA